MRTRLALAGFGTLSLCCCLLLLSGCGSNEPMPEKEGMKAGMMAAPMTMAPVSTAYACPKCGATSAMAGDCAHCKVAMVAKPAVYACPKCDEMSATAGQCSKCGKPMVLEPVANPDPTMCPISHEKIEKMTCAMVGDKVYGFCCADCVAEAKAHPEKLATAAPMKMEGTMNH